MKLVVGNFKMNLLKDDISNYIEQIKKYNFSNVIYCPSNIYLQEFIDNKLLVGVQDVSPFEIGSYTGDVSALQLESIGVSYSIIGHSERRKYYLEKEILINKLNLSQKNNIIPIYCIGETKEEYENAKTLDVLINQIDYVFNDIDLNNIILAYEPIWSIGTGLVPNNDEIYKIIDSLKKYVYNKYGIYVKVLYGGSVSNKNINQLEKVENIDGYLVGGCSIKVNDFIEMIKIINKC